MLIALKFWKDFVMVCHCSIKKKGNKDILIYRRMKRKMTEQSRQLNVCPQIEENNLKCKYLERKMARLSLNVIQVVRHRQKAFNFKKRKACLHRRLDRFE